MRLIIHRGTHEIGGSCVELISDSGQSRILIDIGIPLISADGSQFESKHYSHLSIKELLDLKILPQVAGLYQDEMPTISGVLISHGHQDHYGFLKYLNTSVPVYTSEGTKALFEISNVFLDMSVCLGQVIAIKPWKAFTVGEFSVTSYLMDHSAPDSLAFLIECDGKRLFYSGDFRAHGRKKDLLDRLALHPPAPVDYLILEGTMVGRQEGLYKSEQDVESAIENILKHQTSFVFFICSSQNLDRIVSVYRAATKTGKKVVIDLYTAFVLDKLRIISNKVPQFNWDNVRVIFPYSHAKKIASSNVQLLYKYNRSKIKWTAIESNPADYVILCKDNPYLYGRLNKMKMPPEAKCIYSMWHGYLDKSKLREVLAAKNIELIEIHTSGHAVKNDLIKLTKALNPQVIVPIHTFNPADYFNLFPNVKLLNDGELYYV